MKKNLMKILIPSVLAIVVVGVLAVNGISGSGKMSSWGKWLSDNKEDNDSNGDYRISQEGRLSKKTVDKDEIYEIGNDIIITKKEIKQGIKFYELSDSSNIDIEEVAKRAIEEVDALYIEAIKNGCDVDDKEIKEKIDYLKDLYKTSENKDDIADMISGFDSEDEFWKYEYSVYEKQLPIEKYVKSLENDYRKIYDGDEEEFVDSWNEELNKIKNDLVEKQEYKEYSNEKAEKFKVN